MCTSLWNVCLILIGGYHWNLFFFWAYDSCVINAEIISATEERLNFTIAEGSPPNTLVGQVPTKAGAVYRLSERNPYFTFDTTSGEILTTADILDREKLQQSQNNNNNRVELIILGINPSYFITVHIHVLDINDNAPEFPLLIQNLSISESAKIGTKLLIPRATDKDLEQNGLADHYRIVSGNEEGKFKLVKIKKHNSGEDETIFLELVQPLDRESRSLYVLNISARDNGKPPLTGHTTLLINVLDSNDNSPLFTQQNYRVRLSENVAAGSAILTLSATDLDINENGKLSYAIPDEVYRDKFSIDPVNAVITTKSSQLTCDGHSSGQNSADEGGQHSSNNNSNNCSRLCLFPVEATDHGSPPQKGRAFVHVELEDENDHAPLVTFRYHPPGTGYVSVDESSQSGTVITVVTVTDGDMCENGRTSVELTAGNELGDLSLESSDLFSLLRVSSRPLNRRRTAEYNLTLTARDYGRPPRSTTRQLLVRVTAVASGRNQPPVLEHSQLAVKLSAAAPVGSFVAALSLKNSNDNENNDNDNYDDETAAVFAITSGNELRWFRIDNSTGLITTATPLDITQQDSIQLTVKVSRGVTAYASTSATVDITLRNVNQFAPSFTDQSFNVNVVNNNNMTSLVAGALISRLKAIDNDYGLAGTVRFKLAQVEAVMDAMYSNKKHSLEDRDLFTVDPVTGKLFLSRDLNAASSSNAQQYRLLVTAYDLGTPSLSSTTTVTVSLPRLQQGNGVSTSSTTRYPAEYFVNLLNDSPVGTVILDVKPLSSVVSKQHLQLQKHPQMLLPMFSILQAPANCFEVDRQGSLLLRQLPPGRNVVDVVIGLEFADQDVVSNTTVHVFIVASQAALLPRFITPSYRFSVEEGTSLTTSSELAVGKVIGTVSATDIDSQLPATSSRPSQPAYVLTEDGNGAGVFSIGRYSGEIRAVRPIDRELQASYNLSVVAVGRKGVSRVEVWVSVTDLNDNVPTFGTGSKAEVDIKRSLPQGYPILFAVAHDPDEGANGAISYSLVTINSSENAFTVSKRMGTVRLRRAAFLLESHRYQLNITASDSGNPSLSSSLLLTVHVTDDLNSFPMFARRSQELVISESTPVNRRILKLESARSSSHDVVFKMKQQQQQLIDRIPFGVFPDGWVFVQRRLDFETAQFHELTVEAIDSANRTAVIDVHVTILDENDNSPKCSRPRFAFSVTENSEPLSFVGQLQASDDDSGLNGRLRYSLLINDHRFLVNETTGTLWTLVSFDRERFVSERGSDQVLLEVAVSDNGIPIRSTQCSVEVTIEDQNDNSPQFSMTFFEAVVPENAEVGVELQRISAMDPDYGRNGALVYNIVNGNEEKRFRIDKVSGRVLLSKPLDFEMNARYVLNVSVSDAGKPRRSAFTTLSVRVDDVNDNVPQFRAFPGTLNVSESTPVGTVITVTKAEDRDRGANGDLRYSIIASSVPKCLEINHVTGQLTLVAPLDYESLRVHTIIISAADQGIPSLSSSLPLTIRVVDENDNAPLISSSSIVASISENAPISQPVLTVVASDADSNANAKLRFLIVSQLPTAVFAINELTGLITTMAPLDRESIDRYEITVQVEDQPLNASLSLSSRRSISILVADVNDNAPEFVGTTAAIVPAGSVPGYKIAQLTARDADAGLNASVGFRILNSNNNDTISFFGLSTGGSLYLKSSLPDNIPTIQQVRLELFDQSEQSDDFLRERTYREILDYQPAAPRLRTEVEFSVILLSDSDAGGSLNFGQDLYTFEVSEDAPLKSIVGNVSVTKTTATNVEYFITRVLTNGSDISPVPVSIDRIYGAIFVSGPLDYDSGFSKLLLDIYAVSLSADGGQARISSCKAKISILDVNDSPPKFTDEALEAEINEDALIGSKVAVAFAFDADSNGILVYSFAEPIAQFSIDPQTGIVTTQTTLDRETMDLFQLTITVTDGQHLAARKLLVRVLDVNDNDPSFSQGSYHFMIVEGVPKGAFVGVIKANDVDFGVNRQLQLRIVDEESPGIASVFSIDSMSGILTTNGFLDYEQVPSYQFTVEARDNGTPQRHSRVDVTIDLIDLNDNAPMFSLAFYNASVLENATIDTPVTQLLAQDLDTNTEFSFEVLSGDPWQHFSINHSGFVHIRKPLDREFIPVYHLTVTVHDQSTFSEFNSNRLFTTVTHLTIAVLDVNDQSPIFISPAVIVIPERLAVGSYVTSLLATDKDEGFGGMVRYYIDSLSAGQFGVDAVSGSMFLNKPLPLQPQTQQNPLFSMQYDLIVWAYDQGCPQLSASQQLRIKLLPSSNANQQPRFLENLLEFELAENVQIGKSVAQLEAKSDVPSAAVHYWIASGDPYHDFVVEPESGELVVAKSLSIHKMSLYILTIRAVNILQLFDGSTRSLHETRNASESIKVGQYATVVINVTDVNNYVPQFIGQPYHVTVLENQSKVPVVIGQTFAVDFDKGLNSKLSYSIIQGNTSLFSIDSHTGQLKVNMPLDREQREEYELTVAASDSGSPRLTGTAIVLITVLDVNDNAPVFEQPYYVVKISESSLPGTSLLQLKATDIDDGADGVVKFSLLDDSLPFAIDDDTNELRTIAKLDFESQNQFNFSVVATDSGLESERSSAVIVTVFLLDENDNSPVISKTENTVYIPSVINAGDFVYVVDADDADSGENGALHFSLSGHESAAFRIDISTGAIWAVQQLRYASNGGSVTIGFTVSDGGNPTRSANGSITFVPRPGAEFPEFIAPQRNSFSVSEDSVGAELFTLSARSAKQPPFNRLMYAIVGGNKHNAFSINRESGTLRTTSSIDREYQASYHLFLSATDNDSPPLTAFYSIEVNVTDANDNAPQFEFPNYYAAVPEEEAPGLVVASVLASDADDGANGHVTYSIPSSLHQPPFVVDEVTGVVSTTEALDREKQSTYNFTIIASDNGSPPKTSFTVVSVSVDDVNDNAPRFSRLFSASVPEDAEIGAFILKVTSSDADAPENSNNSYQLSSNETSVFRIDPKSGDISLSMPLDREMQSDYSLKVAAVDGSWRIETSVSISVTDVNDCAPKFSKAEYNFRVAETLFFESGFSKMDNSEIGRLLAQDSDERGPNSEISFRLQQKSEFFGIGELDGVLRLKRPVYFTRNNAWKNSSKFNAINNVHRLVVLARDHGRPPLEGQTVVNIEVIEENKNSPKFDNERYVVAVESGLPAFSKIFQLVAQDEDDGANGLISYAFMNSTVKGFIIDANTGWITNTELIPQEIQGNEISLAVVAQDNGSPRLSTTAIVKLLVTSQNQFAPEFSLPVYRHTLRENAPFGLTVLNISATDRDEGLNGQISYSIDAATNKDGHFTIIEETGAISVNGSIDCEMKSVYNLSILAKDNGFQQKMATVLVQITVADENDNVPQFTAPWPLPMQAFIAENMPAGTVVHVLSATDVDVDPKNRKVQFDIFSGNEAGLFQLDQDSGYLTTLAMLDYEASAQHNLTVSVRNPSGNSSQMRSSSIGVLLVNVVSVNEFAPKFLAHEYNFSVAENSAIGQTIGHVLATDHDSGADGVVFYYLALPSLFVSGSVSAFEVHRLTGEIKVSRPLSMRDSIQFSIIARNRFSSYANTKSASLFFDKATVSITIVSANEAPQIARNLFQVSVLENAAPGTEVLAISAQLRNGGAARYQLAPSVNNESAHSAPTTFEINAKTGVITVSGSIDRETTEAYNLTVLTVNERYPSIIATTTVLIEVMDVNDNSPLLPANSEIGYVMENDLKGLGIMTLNPIDLDSSPRNRGPFVFKQLNLEDMFSVDKMSGFIKSAAVFDREAVDQFQLLVEIRDSGNPVQSSTATVTIYVRDTNDESSTTSLQRVTVALIDGWFPGGRLANVRPADRDLVGSYECHVTDNNLLENQFVMDSGCWLTSAAFQNPNSIIQSVSLNGWDGVHDAVDYNVTLEFQTIHNSTLEDSVELLILASRSPSAQDILDYLNQQASNKNLMLTILGLQAEEDFDIERELISSCSVDLQQRITVSLSSKSSSKSLSRSEAALELHSWIYKNSTFLHGGVAILDPCAPNPCQNNGSCSSIVHQREISYRFLSLRNSSLKSSSLSLPQLRREFACRCSDEQQFGGERCELVLNRCAAQNPCQNGGSCVLSADNGNHRATCVCAPGFTGQTCSQEINECSQPHGGSNNPCQNGGFCENTRGSYRCICLLGFSGQHCEQPVDHCVLSPCLHDGECVRLASGYRCRCQFGFSGRNCEVGSFGFNELSFLELMGQQLASRENRIALEFATTQRNSLLLYSFKQQFSGSGGKNNGDFVAVEIVNGRLRLSAKLAGQNQTTALLPKPVSDGRWYQLRLNHQSQAISISIGECVEGEAECQQCAVGDSKCHVQLITTSSQSFGDKLFIGGVASFDELLKRPGLVAFTFVGCIRMAKVNGRSLEKIDAKKMHNILDFCPRNSVGVCALGVCSQSETCIDKWDKHACICDGGFQATDCRKANEPVNVDQGSFVQYRLKESILKQLLFSPLNVHPQQLEDDIVRRSLSASVLPEHWLNIRVKTLLSDGLLFFSASGQDFTVIDIMNGTLRYSSKNQHGEIGVALFDEPSVADGQWHSVSLALEQFGKKVVLRLDDREKSTLAQRPVHEFLGPKVTELSVGGSAKQISIDRRKLEGFSGCLSRFIVDGVLQPLGSGESELLTAEVVGSIKAGVCSSGGLTSDCVFPPCLSRPLLTSQETLSTGVIAVIVFFACLIVAMVTALPLLRRIRARKLAAASSSSRTSIVGCGSGSVNSESTKCLNLNTTNAALSRVLGLGKDLVKGNSSSQSGGIQSVSQAISQPTIAPYFGDAWKAGLSTQNILLNSSNSSQNLPQFSASNVLPFQRQISHLLNAGAYQNQLDTTQDEHPEHYDLDNASSIASDAEGAGMRYNTTNYRLAPSLLLDQPVSLSEKSLRTPASIANRSALLAPPASCSLASARLSSRHLRNNSCKTTSRNSSNSIGLLLGSSSGRCSRASSAHSNRSRMSRRRTPSAALDDCCLNKSSSSLRSGRRSSSQCAAADTVKDIQRNRMSYRRPKSAQSTTSTSSCSPPPGERRPRRPPSSRRSIRRSPHAPPLFNNSSSVDEDAVAINKFPEGAGDHLDLELDLDAVIPKSSCKQQPLQRNRSRSRQSQASKYASEHGGSPSIGFGPATASAVKRVPGLTSSTSGYRFGGRSDFLFGIAQPSEDETQSEAGVDEGEDGNRTVPDLSNFVSRCGEFPQLISKNYSAELLLTSLSYGSAASTPSRRINKNSNAFKYRNTAHDRSSDDGDRTTTSNTKDQSQTPSPNLEAYV